MAVTDALQDALAGEHAVIWGYGVVGAEVTEEQRPDVRAAEQAHRTRRDATADLLRSMAAVPAQAQAYYELPFPVTDPTSGLRLAVHLEQGCVGQGAKSDTSQLGVVGLPEDVPPGRRSALLQVDGQAQS